VVEIAEVVGIYLPAFMVAAIYLGSALEWIARRFFRRAYISWVFLILPIFMFSMNFARVDQSKHVLHAQVVEGILKKADHDALIIADNYEYASYIYYYLFAEGHGKRNLYTIADFNIKPEQVLAYLKGEKSIEIYQQRLTLPYGLRVYVMKVPAARFDIPGLTLQEVVKNLYQISTTE
jgi:hypothetical protein